MIGIHSSCNPEPGTKSFQLLDYWQAVLNLFSNAEELQQTEKKNKGQDHSDCFVVNIIPGYEVFCLDRFSNQSSINLPWVNGEPGHGEVAHVAGADGVQGDEDGGAEQHEEDCPQPLHVPLAAC